jgi:hypothetical protein
MGRAGGELLASLIPALAGVGEANFRIGSEVELFLAAINAIFHSPELSARRLHKQKQAERIAQLVGLGARLRVANGDSGQSHIWGPLFEAC